MPDYMSANMDPIVNAIKGFGEGLAGNALKKVQIDRQLGRDIYEAARTEAATNWDKSRTAHQKLQTKNLEDLSSMFNPGGFSVEERNALAAAAKLGSTSMDDVMRSVGTRHITGYKDDQYRKGNAATQLSVALNKAVMPYQMDGDTGAILNRMDGTSTVNQAVLAASKFLKGDPAQGGGSGGVGVSRAPRLISPNDLENVFEDVIEEKDVYGNPVRRKVRNQAAMDEFVAYSQRAGIPMTAENAMLYRAGLLGALQNNQQPNQAPAPVIPSGVMGEKTASVVTNLPPNIQQYVSLLLEDYRDKKIRPEELAQLLQETGYFK